MLTQCTNPTCYAVLCVSPQDKRVECPYCGVLFTALPTSPKRVQTVEVVREGVVRC